MRRDRAHGARVPSALAAPFRYLPPNIHARFKGSGLRQRGATIENIAFGRILSLGVQATGKVRQALQPANPANRIETGH